MRALGELRTRLQLALPGADVQVIGIADRHNSLACWQLRVTKDGRTVTRAMRPETPAADAVASIRAELAAQLLAPHEAEA
jgi:hypothetical protein